MAPGSLRQRLNEAVRQEGLHSIGASQALLELPDPEFLTVLEHVRLGFYDHLTAGMAEELFEAADRALRSHGVSYRRVPNVLRFEWMGDPVQHALTVRPALVALADARLDGARVEFEEALAKRRQGAPKDLEDAVDEAAKSVESALKILHHERGVPLPAKEQLAGLFNRLASDAVNILPGYLDHLVLAPGGPRNHMASHGQGTSVREVPEELADAAIAAAAVAITLLAHYLP